MAPDYPKEVKVRDGSTIVLKPFEKKDKDALFLFFQKLTERDRLFLKDNVTDPAVVERWATELNYDKVFPLLAWRGNEVVADATLHKNLGGWMKHVGTIRIVVASDYHRQGLGSILANELFLHALKCGLEKIVAEMMETQPGAKKVFEKLGFRQEAVFHGHVRDQIGVRHDLLILTKDLEDFWANIQTHEYFSYPSRDQEGA
jgi:ribosomal protein S18 acetylase RimI-like enzyme